MQTLPLLNFPPSFDLKIDETIMHRIAAEFRNSSFDGSRYETTRKRDGSAQT